MGEIFRRGLLILLILGAILLPVGGNLMSAPGVMRFHVLAAGIVLAIGSWFLFRNRPAALRTHPKPVYPWRTWLSAAWPLVLAGSMHHVARYADILMLGAFGTAEEVGVYRVAVQIAWLVVFGMRAVTLVVLPYIARLHSQGEHRKLQELITLGTQGAFYLSLPVAVAFVIWGDVFLRLLFGTAYVGGYGPLAILAIGQVISALFSFVDPLLNMTGHERDTARVVAIAAGTNILLNLLLIPSFGMYGAAAATTLSLALWNIWLWRIVHRHLGIESMAFRIFS